MNTIIGEILAESARLKHDLSKDARFVDSVARAAARLSETVAQGGTIYACGNGGSTCDAMHLCEELVARFKRTRPGIRAMHFMDASVLTCWGNDVGFEDAFNRYAETFCTPVDTLVAISTSGRSKNVLAAVEAAKQKGCPVIGLTGKDGGALLGMSDYGIVVPAPTAERIQEVHITVIHAWCELLEGGYPERSALQQK